MIILGDIDPRAMDDNTWRIISECVKERAAMLVMIAGPRYMPHGISPAGSDLVPVETYERTRTFYSAGEEPFRFALTAEGRNHPITQQSTGEAANETIWRTSPRSRGVSRCAR